MMRARGFSLIEMMIAITLALLVSLALVSVFIGSRTAFQSTSGQAALTDSGRFALDLIQNSLRNAGYMACNTASRTTTILNSTALPYAFTEQLGGFEANNTNPGTTVNVVAPPVAADGAAGDWAGNLDASLVGLVVKGNDVLVTRSSLANAQASYVATIANGASSFTVNAAGALMTGQIAVISDCYKGVSFQITGVAGTTINHSNSGTPGNNSASFGTLSFAPGVQVTPLDTYVYYIGKGADGDGALFMTDLYNGSNVPVAAIIPSELVPDIEAMQILYGIDTTGTQTVSQYVTAQNVPDFNLVMSVKVAVLAASAIGSASTPPVALTYNLLGTTVTAPIDTRARQVFESTTAIRNALP